MLTTMVATVSMFTAVHSSTAVISTSATGLTLSSLAINSQIVVLKLRILCGCVQASLLGVTEWNRETSLCTAQHNVDTYEHR